MNVKDKNQMTLGKVYGYAIFKKKSVINQRIYSKAKISQIIEELRYHYPEKGPNEITWEDFGNIKISNLRQSNKLANTNLETKIEDLQQSYILIIRRILSPFNIQKKAVQTLLFFLDSGSQTIYWW